MNLSFKSFKGEEIETVFEILVNSRMTVFRDYPYLYICSAPKELSIFETTWGSFGIQIFYDVEFSIASQMLGAKSVNLILAPSCTETLRGATRVHIGARARALKTNVK